MMADEAGHAIDYEALAADNFDTFFEVRRKSLLELIAAATLSAKLS